MKCKCAVTFEFEINAPLTWRGEISGTEPQTVVMRAVMEAKKAYPRVKWNSMNVVILERLGEENELPIAELVTNG